VVSVAVKGEKGKEGRRKNLQLQQAMIMVLLAKLLLLPLQLLSLSLLNMEEVLLVRMKLSHVLQAHRRRKGPDGVVGVGAAQAALLVELLQLKFQASCSVLTLPLLLLQPLNRVNVWLILMEIPLVETEEAEGEDEDEEVTVHNIYIL
jgi:hypothetical protein